MKKTFLLLLTSLLFGACQTSAPAHQHSEPLHFTVLHLNDVYEIAPLEEGTVGGMARVVSLEKQLRSLDPNTLTVLAGDFLSPSVIGTVKLNGERVQGQQMVELMNLAGVDWVVFGNHEFDIKEDALQKRINESAFGWIAGNVRHQRGDLDERFTQNGKELPDYTIWRISNPRGPDVRVGVIGVCLDANQQAYVHYEDVFASAKADYARIKDSVDFCIALTHLSIEEDRQLARHIPQLKLIMGGHEHERHFERVGNVPIAKADANAKSAWIHRFSWDGQQLQLTSYLEELGEHIALDPEASALVQQWEETAYAAFKEEGLNLAEPICRLKTPLDGREVSIRTAQTNLGIALTHAMYEASEDADCAIINGGSVRIDDYLRGTITQFDLVRALPFGGAILKVDMRGSLLQQTLEAGEANFGNGGYLQRYQVAKKEGNWQVNGQAIDPDKKYRVAISDFLMTGLESRMDFLTPDNPGVIAVITPGTDSPLRDIRLVLADFLKKQ